MATLPKWFICVLFSAFLAAPLAWSAPAEIPDIVNINQADAETIALVLKGVGEVKAKAIVDWREAHGPFQAIDELLEIKGIGEALLAKNRSAIVID